MTESEKRTPSYIAQADGIRLSEVTLTPDFQSWANRTRPLCQLMTGTIGLTLWIGNLCRDCGHEGAGKGLPRTVTHNFRMVGECGDEQAST